MERELNDQEKVRRAKMEDLRAKGIDPFGQAYVRTANSRSIREGYDTFDKEELEAKNIDVSIAGRIMSKRRMGKMCFMHIQDKDGQIQLVINKADVGEEVYELVKASDIGDIIGVKGIVYRTNPNDNNPKGELSVYVKEYTHLSKALRPLPEKFHGLTDVEERYRRRYVDLIMNEEAKRIAFLRPRIIRAIQKNFDSQGLVEVETPVDKAIAKRIAGKKMAVVPILRAGLGMVDGMVTMIPSVKVGHIGLYRDPKTMEPVE